MDILEVTYQVYPLCAIFTVGAIFPPLFDITNHTYWTQTKSLFISLLSLCIFSIHINWFQKYL